MQNNIEVNSENIEKYSNDLAELAEDFKHVGSYEVSIFKPDENTEIDRDTFLEYIKCATGENGFDEETANLYFDLLNANGGDTLDYDELTKIMNKNGEVSDFSMWQNLAFSISSTGVISSAANYTIISSSNSKDVADNIKDVYGEDSDEYKAALAGQDVTISKQTLKSDKIDEIVTKIINGDAKLEDYEDLLTEDSYKALKEAYEKAVNKGNEEDSTVKTNESEKTEGTSTDKTDDNATVSTEEVETTDTNETQYDKINPETCADQLFEAMDGLGTDEATLEDILCNMNISPEQFAEMIEIYEEKYGLLANPPGRGLVTRIEKDTSGDLQTKLTSSLGSKLLDAAKAGNEKAIDLLCVNLYSGTAGQNCTADDFLAAVFDTENPDYELLYKINERYSDITKKLTGSSRDLIEDIQGDHGGFLNFYNWFGNWGGHGGTSGKGGNYIDLIKQAKRRHIDD